jgi:hypothetical protein
MKPYFYVLALFLSIWFGLVIILKAARGQSINAGTFIVFAASATAVITHITGVW